MTLLADMQVTLQERGIAQFLRQIADGIELNAFNPTGFDGGIDLVAGKGHVSLRFNSVEMPLNPVPKTVGLAIMDTTAESAGVSLAAAEQPADDTPAGVASEAMADNQDQDAGHAVDSPDGTAVDSPNESADEASDQASGEGAEDAPAE